MVSSNLKRIVWVTVIMAALLIGAASVFALDGPGLGKSQKLKPSNGVVTSPLSKR